MDDPEAGTRFAKVLTDLSEIEGRKIGPTEFALLMGYASRADGEEVLRKQTSRVSQWKARGLPRDERHRVIEKLREKYKIELNPNWLADGVGMQWLTKPKHGQMKHEKPLANVKCFDQHALTQLPTNCVIHELIIQEEWLQRNFRVTEPHSLSVREMSDDSMHPTIKQGDFVFIDIGATVINDDGSIYVFTFDGETFIKRISRTPKKLAFTSDNKTARNWDLRRSELSKLHIHGRVVGSWGLKRL